MIVSGGLIPVIRNRTRAFLSVIGAAVFAAISTTPLTAAPQASPLAGVWKLNEAQSSNPNGPAAPDRRGGGGGGSAPRSGGGGGGRGGFDPTGGARAAEITQLSAEETARIGMVTGLMHHAAQTLEIVFEGTDITIKQDGGGFPKQPADGKKMALKNPKVGELDIKVKLDGTKGMTREVTTQEDLKVVETYTLSADGKQLTVTVKESHPVKKLDDPKIKRVYDRQ